MSAMRGRFVTFEGIDGAGKTSHMEQVVRAWQAAGHEVVRTREPGGTDLAERLRELILHQSMDALTEALLVFAARRDHLTQVIWPALERGAWVVCDRFTDATYAYQGHGRGFDLATLASLEAWVQQGAQPDLTLLFDLPVQVAAARLNLARTPDRFEALDLDFFERVRQGYLQRMRAQPERFVCIDAQNSPEQVAAQVVQALSARGLR